MDHRITLSILKENGIERPRCFDFAISFLGGPEDVEIVEYIEKLEDKVARLLGEVERLKNSKNAE